MRRSCLAISIRRGFAGGTLTLQPELARAAIERVIATPLGMSVEQAALGIHRVLNAQMAEAIRLVSIGRGIDPRGYALLPLGGGGPMHALRPGGGTRDRVDRRPGASRRAVGCRLARRAGGA